MVDSATKSGAKFSFDTEITDPVGRGQWVIGVKTKDGKIINGRIIVDCSGVERILTKNIEILDLNTKISSKKYVETFYSQNKIEQKEKLLNEIELENNAFYYFFDREFYSRIEKENKTISFFTVLNKKLTKRKAKAVTNEIINKSKGINISPIISYSDKSVVRRPITLAWYGFLSIGEAAFQINPFNIEGSGPALIALKIVSKVLLEALQRREASIYRLWNYHAEFFKLVGKHLAALEAFRTHILRFEKDKWLIDVPVLEGGEYSYSLQDGNLTTEKVKSIKRICWETNGLENPNIIREMARLSLESRGIIKIDWKAYTPSVYEALTGINGEKALQRIKENIRVISSMDERKEPPLLVVSTLVVPHYIDEEEVRGIARYLSRINPYIPYILLAFAPQHLMHDVPTTSKRQMERVCTIARKEGLKRVFIGNFWLLR